MRILVVCLLLLCAPQLMAQPYAWPIDQGWQFRQVGTEIWYAATAPGVVQQDLIEQGVVPDPFYGEQEKDIQWIEDENWEYRTVFPRPQESYHHYSLVFHGLDTYALVWLNDELIVSGDNMFRRYEVDVTDLLKVKNELRIEFQSPISRHAAKLSTLKYHKTAGNDARPEARVSVYTRKAPYQFGWDWGPRIVTTGIWQPVALHGWNDIRLTGFHLYQNYVGEEEVSGVAEFRFEGELQPGMEIRVVDMATDSVWSRYHVQDAMQTSEQFPFLYEGIKRWWPHTLGSPHLYQLQLQVWSNGNLLDHGTQQIGFRDIQLIQEEDDIGTSYYFTVNGVPFYAMGANVVPPDPILPRQSKDDWKAIVQNAHAAGMNMLRAWGGGIYPPDAFYDACDELGILVWQDFMFACSMYPADEDFLSSVQEEVIQQVERIQPHASLALWCGNNEVDVAWHNWGWQQQFGLLQGDSAAMWQDYLRIFHERIPRLLRIFDPNRAYVTTSPLSNWGKLDNFNHSSMHYWGVWHGPDRFEKFYTYVPRFMSEYGFQSFPGQHTVRSFTDNSHFNLDDPVMQHHQKSYIGNQEIDHHLRRYYPRSTDFEDFLYKSQVTQALAMEMAIGAHRSRAGHNMGTLYWQLNDTWPGPSWSTVDYYGRWKAAHFTVQRMYQPLLAGGRYEKGALEVWAHNATAQDEHVTIKVIQHDFRGAEKILYSEELTLLMNGKISLPNLAYIPRRERRNTVTEISLWKNNNQISRTVAMAVKPKQLFIPKPSLDVRLDTSSQTITVTSSTYCPDIWLELPEEARLFENFITLLPGETRVISYEGDLDSEKQIEWKSWAR